MNHNKEKSINSDLAITRWILLLVLCLLFTLIYILYKIYESNITYNFNESVKDPGQIGDIIGGISSPIIGLIGALLTFLAFWIQYSFNNYQTYQIKQQRSDFEKSRFEGLFFEMIKIHRENINEISIKESSKSRRAFISMFKEFKFCHYTLLKSYTDFRSEEKNKNYELSSKDLVNISFLTFFFGIGESSGDMINSLFIKYNNDLLSIFNNSLRLEQKKWDNLKKNKIVDNSFEYLEPFKMKILTIENKNYMVTLGYKPFTGHLARLGHYFRHLYQTVNFVENQEDEIISKDEKYEYIKMLRSQLSAHEQLLLYYNSLTVMGEPWINSNYLLKYKLIKNIPLPLADIYPIPENIFPKDIFEWEEIKSRL